jgi:hypothetical protein
LVRDHAVIDRALGARCVVTGLAIRVPPPSRARLLQAVAG